MFSQRYSINPAFTANSSLYIHQCGWEDCRPGHSFVTTRQDHYLIHCVFCGCGRLTLRGTVYEVGAGQGFLLPPGIVGTYAADDRDPWHYGWLGFNGVDSRRVLSLCGLSEERPVFTLRDTRAAACCIGGLLEAYGDGGNTFAAIAKMYELLSYLAAEKPPDAKRDIAEAVLAYIEGSDTRGLTVNRIAQQMHRDRSHLFRVFKETVGISLQEYLEHVRMDRAATLLRTTAMNVNEIMTAVGYGNASHFTRQFRKLYGEAPTRYRRYCIGDEAAWDGESSEALAVRQHGAQGPPAAGRDSQAAGSYGD